MIRDSLPGRFFWPPVVLLVFALLLGGGDRCAAAAQAKKRGKVSIVFFYSKECEHCETAALLLKALKKNYPIRLKRFNIDIPYNGRLFEKLEKIHSGNGFAVPLVMLGDSILVGERDIRTRLESTVSKLSRSGGAPFPYLGPAFEPKKRKRKKTRKPTDADCDCEERRPPTLSEEWENIREFLNRFH